VVGLGAVWQLAGHDQQRPSGFFGKDDDLWSDLLLWKELSMRDGFY
jgi:hypothetical protein